MSQDSLDDHADRILVIGAGLAGLTAARRLAEAGRQVLVVDKGRSVGGRLATRRIGDAVLDHGAQFFTVRSDDFRAAVDRWIAADVVAEWCRGFDAEADGYPRYRTNGGMNQLGKHLAAEATAAGVEVVTKQRAQSIINAGDQWAVSYDGGTREPDETAAVITTAPVPQSLELLASGGVPVSGPVGDSVRALRYHMVVGLLTTVAGTPDLGAAGALQQPDDPTFTFVADNKAKGISPEPAVTFHAAHELSAELWDRSDDEIHDTLRPRAQALLGDVAIATAQVKKWRYAGPVASHPDRAVTLATTPGPLVVAGDAFGGPKVEGAFLSGLAAAAAVLD